MSPKQRLAQAVEELPESLTIEEAMEHLVQTFKPELTFPQAAPELAPLPVLEGRVPQGWKDALQEE